MSAWYLIVLPSLKVAQSPVKELKFKAPNEATGITLNDLNLVRPCGDSTRGAAERGVGGIIHVFRSGPIRKSPVVIVRHT